MDPIRIYPAIELPYENPGESITMQFKARFQQEPRDPGVRKLNRYSKNSKKYLRRTTLKKFQ
jgi:hypothetical protein